VEKSCFSQEVQLENSSELAAAMKRKEALFIALCLFLLGAPTAAQPVLPTPTPPSDSNVINALSNAAQIFGPVVLALFILLIATVALSIIAAWKLWLPTIQTNQQANQQIVLMSAQLNQGQIDALNAQTKTAAAVERMGTAIIDLETRKEALENRRAAQQKLDDNTRTITQHIDNAVKPLGDDVAGLRNDFAEFAQYAGQILDKLATKDDLATLVHSLKAAIEGIAERISQVEPVSPKRTEESEP
jgi:hypothetical protein